MREEFNKEKLQDHRCVTTNANTRSQHFELAKPWATVSKRRHTHIIHGLASHSNKIMFPIPTSFIYVKFLKIFKEDYNRISLSLLIPSLCIA